MLYSEYYQPMPNAQPPNANQTARNNPKQQNQTQPGSPSTSRTADQQPRSANQEQTQNQQQENDEQIYPDSHLEESRIAPGMYRPIPEETILEWEAPSRPFKKHNAKYFSTVSIITLLIALILGFAGQLAAVTVVIAVAFLVYILSVVPPQDIAYKITNYGIYIQKSQYLWQELGSFWFDEKHNQPLVYISTFRFPSRITLLLGDQDQDFIESILSEVLLNKEPEPTLYDKTSEWLQEKIPLDSEE